MKKFQIIVTHYSGMTIRSMTDELEEGELEYFITALKSEKTTYLSLIDENNNENVIKGEFLANSVITIVYP